MIKEIIFGLDNSWDFIGRYSRSDKTIKICCPAFTQGYHINTMAGDYPLTQAQVTDDCIIDGIIYSIIHEAIHHCQIDAGYRKSSDIELQVYNMVGNGGNCYLNNYYHIARNLKWQRVIEGYIL